MGFSNTKYNLNEDFSEEFLGRFDDIIYFDTLTKEVVLNYLKENIKEDIDYLVVNLIEIIKKLRKK